MSIEPIHIFGDKHSGLHVGLPDGMHGGKNYSMHISVCMLTYTPDHAQ